MCDSEQRQLIKVFNFPSKIAGSVDEKFLFVQIFYLVLDHLVLYTASYYFQEPYFLSTSSPSHTCRIAIIKLIERSYRNENKIIIPLCSYTKTLFMCYVRTFCMKTFDTYKNQLNRNLASQSNLYIFPFSYDTHVRGPLNWTFMGGYMLDEKKIWHKDKKRSSRLWTFFILE